MNINRIKEKIPYLLPDVLKQLKRVNSQPPIHRYIQLHNSFELVVRHLAIISFLWLKLLEIQEGTKILQSFESSLKRPSFDTWKNIFVDCSNKLNDENVLNKRVKDKIESGAIRKVLDDIFAFSRIENCPKKNNSTALIDAIILYRNLTRGHGCVIHRGYESFLDSLDQALFDFIMFWADFLNSKVITKADKVFFVLENKLIDATLFLKVSDKERITFYNRSEKFNFIRRWYFLDYDTGLHSESIDQKERLKNEFRLLSSGYQMSLFPVSKNEIEIKYGKAKIKKVEKYLSYDYNSTREFHPAQEFEVKLLTSIRIFADKVKRRDPFEFLVSSLTNYSNQGSLQDQYFDFFDLQWKSFSEKEEEAIDRYLENINIEESLDILEEKLQDYTEDLKPNKRQELLIRISNMLEELEEQDQDY